MLVLKPIAFARTNCRRISPCRLEKSIFGLLNVGMIEGFISLVINEWMDFEC